MQHIAYATQAAPAQATQPDKDVTDFFHPDQAPVAETTDTESVVKLWDV